MSRIFKWLIRGSLAIFLIFMSVSAIGYLILQRSIPSESGNAELANLSAITEVILDKEGVPHIEAANLQDAVRVMGYLHARDRLWQMELSRMAGQGRLSEIFGNATLNTDIFLRTIDLAESARSSYLRLKPRSKELLEAYTGGVNSYVFQKSQLFSPKLQPEFLILGHTPEKWEPWQSVLIIKLMALTLDNNLDQEIKRLAMASQGFNPKEIDDIMPYGPKESPPPLPDLRYLYGFDSRGKVAKFEDQNAVYFGWDLAWPTGVTASNNWVLSGDRTVSAKPILANDPHLELTAPSAFYLAHLKYRNQGEVRHLIGGTLPGLPLMVVGRNESVAWGITTTVLDSQDLFIEQINPENPKEYRIETGWETFIEEPITVKVAGGADYQFVRRRTRHGPVLPEKYKNLETLLPDKHVAALKWVALSGEDTTVDAVIGMTEARSVGEYIENSRSYVSPMQSMVIGDIKGNIGLIAPGVAPVRHRENKIHGRAPVPGWIPKYEWQGKLSFSDLPQGTNPSEGAFVTANANFLLLDYPHHITFDWAEPFRQIRLENQIVKTRKKQDVSDSRKLLADDFSLAMIEFRDAAFQVMTSGSGSGDPLLRALQDWDGRMDASRPEPLIMMAWFKNLHREMLFDDLGKAYKYFERGRLNAVLHILRYSVARDWCDKRNTAPTESCGQMVRRSLDMATDEISQTEGRDWRKWRYGKLHVANGEHRPFAQNELLARYFNIVVPTSGGPYTLLRGQTDFSKTEPYRNRTASAYRAVYDFSDLDSSIYIQSTGQSGHFMSRFYRNFSNRWAGVEFISMSTRRADYEPKASGTWVFRPKPE